MVTINPRFGHPPRQCREIPQCRTHPVVGAIGDSAVDGAVARDIRTLVLFISLYCRHRHKDVAKEPVAVQAVDFEAIGGSAPMLCPDCTKLLVHASVKRIHCPVHPKPACKHCHQHCYYPKYRERIKEVMKFSGRRLVLSGRLDLLLHLLF
ncbi:MAG: nitrous oxide-stimulated promoter family protein [Planctomycetota bacterium]|jgi:hypothetical protein